ncbi:enolase, partial [Tanacetum coccineum]
QIVNLAQNKTLVLPVPTFDLINGGSGNKIAMRDYMILPVGASSFKEAMKMGGSAPIIQKNKGLELLKTAIAKDGYSGKEVGDVVNERVGSGVVVDYGDLKCLTLTVWLIGYAESSDVCMQSFKMFSGVVDEWDLYVLPIDSIISSMAESFSTKPSIILLDGDMEAREADFGVAKLIECDESMLVITGSYGYIAHGALLHILRLILLGAFFPDQGNP